MNDYINKLKEKSEVERKKYALFATVGCMAIVTFIWISSMGARFNSEEVAQEQSVRPDVKPMALLGESLKNTYNNVSASVGSAPSFKEIFSSKKNDKVIELIPVER